MGIFVLHSLYRTTHQNFSPNSSQFITPCLVTAPVTEISKFHLRELLGLGVPNKVGLANLRKTARGFLSELVSEFFPQNVWPSFSIVSSPPRKFAPKLSAFLWNFTFSNPTFFLTDFLLTWEIFSTFGCDPGRHLQECPGARA